jgi:hypothetical protein
MKSSLMALLVVAATVVASVGCTGGGRVEAKKYPVTGTVTVDGQPLADGMIYFKDIASGAADSAEIKAGQFTGNAEAGKRRVEIFAYKTQTSDMGGVTTETKTNILPPRFNSESTLSEEVKPETNNTFKFEVATR